MLEQEPRPPGQERQDEHVQVADLLRRDGEDILADWQQAPPPRPHGVDLRLLSHLRALLEGLADVLEYAPDEAPVELPESLLDMHAFERLDPDLEPHVLAAEYGRLRRSILHHLESLPTRPHPEELARLEEALDEAEGRAIARHVQAQEQATRLEAQRSLAVVDTLLGAAPVGLAVVDPELRYLRINTLLADINGHPVQEHLGRTVRQMVTPEVWTHLEPLLRRVLESGEPVAAELTTLKLGGQPRHWRVNYFPVRGGTGELLGVGTAVVDITAHKEAEATLERSVTFREQLLAMLGHDLRNPLNAIAASAFQLARTADLEERERQAVERIRRSTGRMGRMIDDLLDFARSRLGGGIPVAPRPMDLAEVCRAALDELQASQPQRRLLFEARGDTRGAWDPDRVTQVVGNLVVNSLQHGRADSPVRVTVRAEDAEVLLEVHNEGEPIPAELLPRLFEAFEGGARPPGSSNLGLGLFIVQQIARAHGGDVTVRSAAEAGTTFTVRWPRHPPAH
jgi:PAS domain S-box-containing protein